MNEYFKDIIRQSTGASGFHIKECIQELWSGYGQILRISLQGAKENSIIVKHVQVPKYQTHPRGWNTALSHQRKLKSYQVESHWYSNYSQKSSARLPYCYAMEKYMDEIILVLEDLDESGFYLRKESLHWKDIEACIDWLAQFHATYMDQYPNGLWEVGSYWHLETRPQEWEALHDEKLKEAASLIDQKLNHCRYKTFVHGDAKLANFCFSPTNEVAAVDFQYVGGGCGMKDLAYFIGSCLNEHDCEQLEEKILDHYFHCLQNALPSMNQKVEQDWRSLYRVAWADFHRFIKGWSPNHWKINSYSERITQEVIQQL